ncbi:hypothetical protein [Hydrogenimonas urashimensis]|uniref:hypothetical protein n=1 Tax=Hydrogenimonas urashimensis TaxID=2740515 RepID=UPI0019152B87|nr:hypothetical protein [Hydrogenimonas urashimensis]
MFKKRETDNGKRQCGSVAGHLWHLRFLVSAARFPTTRRPAFGIWQALIIILIVSGLMVVAMRYAKIGAVHTADSYTREQAELFLQSAVEIALLQIAGHKRSSECLDRVHLVSRDGKFTADIAITRYYLLAGSADLSVCGTLGYPVETEESHGMVMMEAVVQSVPGHPKVIHPVRLVRRMVQRP